MSKVKKNIRLCAISTDFSELDGYNAQFIGEQDVKDARDFTAEVIDELGIVADGAILAPFETASELALDCDASEDLPPPGEYTAPLTLFRATADGMENLVVPSVTFTVSEP